MSNLFVDLETRSRCDLLKAGARRYAADPSTRITTAVWYFQGTLKTACPIHPILGSHQIGELYADISACDQIIAHHAAFDVNILMGQNPFCVIPVSKVNCTMARAQALSLPGALESVCKTLKLPPKDKAGRDLVKRTCKPTRGDVFDEDIEKFRALLAYNVQDVRCLMNIHEQLPELRPEERRIFERSWHKNEVGLPVDVELATAIALRRSEIEIEAATQLRDITGNYVTGINQRVKILEWINSGNRNAGLPNTTKQEITIALEDPELHPDVRSVLDILQENGGNAPMKAQALLDRHVNGFYKDATRYHGARSGRGTSEGVNVFNIARPSGRYEVDEVITRLKAGHKLGNIALTDALRACIAAPQGWAIIDNDLSNAELRLALWQAHDHDRLELLNAGGDLYMHNAITMWNLPKFANKNTHPQERYNGKTTTLAGNYQLGWKTYQSHMRKMGMAISDHKAQDDIRNYRRANPQLTRLWDNMKNAFHECYYDPPGRAYYAGKIALVKDGTTIWMMLPSGRGIPHYSVHVDNGNMGFWRAKYGAMLPQKIFGGSLLEISCQSMTRDIITACEDDIEKELPDVILLLDIYDSIVALAPVEIAAQREHQIREIMRRPRSWTHGLPLNAEGYSGPRMKK